jgi:YggT family protein
VAVKRMPEKWGFAGSAVSFQPRKALRDGFRRLQRAMLNPIAALLIEILEIYKWIVIAAVIVSWLVAFNVINTYNNFVRTLLRILMALTEPVFRPIRRILPPIGGLDLSPIVVFVIIWFLQYTITYVSYRNGF